MRTVRLCALLGPIQRIQSAGQEQMSREVNSGLECTVRPSLKIYSSGEELRIAHVDHSAKVSCQALRGSDVVMVNANLC